MMVRCLKGVEKFCESGGGGEGCTAATRGREEEEIFFELCEGKVCMYRDMECMMMFIESVKGLCVEKLINFVSKFMGTVTFVNDQVAAILEYGYYHIGNVTISRVNYVERLGHNLFSVDQLCDSDLKVAFRKHTCFIRDLEGVDLLTGARGTNLYTLSLEDMMRSSPICLLSKASKTKSWLWHRRLSHLNFSTINELAKQGLIRAISSAEAEYVADAGCCANILWMKSQLSDYDNVYDKVPIFCDNTSAIAILNNPIMHSRTKHIDIRYHFIRDHIIKGDIELPFIPT
ncbi:retrovirus-related pol polyprotein from transposon TNT 1-94 [Tanacetum coccineum]